MKTKKCVPFVVKNGWLKGMDHGWGNGYVAVPEGHPLFGKGYSEEIHVADKGSIKFNGNYIGLLCHSFKDSDSVSLDLLIDVHCGLTFSGELSNLRLSGVDFLGMDKLPTEKLWVFGFDTCHCDDNSQNWSKEEVVKETLKLKDILENFTL